MAQRVTTVVICDLPHDEEVDGALPVSLTTPDGTWTLDVCTDHAAEYLMPLVSAAHKTPRRARAAAGKM